MGGHVTTSLVEDLPVPRREESLDETSAIAQLSRQLSEGDRSPQAMAALQAAVAWLYGLTRDEFASVLESFPLVAQSERQMAAAIFATST
jgi:phage I-like protein